MCVAIPFLMFNENGYVLVLLNAETRGCLIC